MYNIIFGMNETADVILATLGLTREDMARFRDCFVSEGKIAVYTRNGGGNRDCSHEDGNGTEHCVHAIHVETVDESREATPEEIAQHPEWKLLNIFHGSKRCILTGQQVQETQYTCLHPNSADCACPGCTITYRLPKHPHYLSDRDDDFDCTYATIYFSFPEEYADDLKALESGTFDPSQRWLDMLEHLRGNLV